MPHPATLWLIPALPLLGAFLCGALHLATLRLRRRDPSDRGVSGLAPIVACGAMLGSLALSIWGFVALTGLEANARSLGSTRALWMESSSLQVHWGLLIDPLSAVLCLVITGVGLLIHVYSSGYMKGDPGYAKFFAYLNLFVAAMLLLVLSDSLLGLFVGWEGVGVCSWLLIGFWYPKGWPAEAAQKAFVTNRVGDASFLIGSFLLVRLFGTLDLASIVDGTAALALAGDHGTELALAALFLFGGACGKSAQIPLFTWLPDAMAGPTPVSALIHAATMVTAGIYLIVRLNPVFAASPNVMLFIGAIGVATAFLGAASALRQRDLKKVLAYSTVSQLGYMFLALGAGAFTAAIFHLVTHAFFKGLLFLGAGSVIHGMHEEQDLHRMGGLRKHMPRTHGAFLFGAAALAGMPLLSGYFSKDEILTLTLIRGGLWPVLWIVGLVTAAITAFYTWRMVALCFYGEERFEVDEVHPHESPSSMTVPLMILAALALCGGVLNLPAVLPVSGLLHHWLEPVTGVGHALLFGDGHAPHPAAWAEWVLLALGAGVAMLFGHLGFHAYSGGTDFDRRMASRQPELCDRLERAFGVDEAYGRHIVQPLKLLAHVISVVIDSFAIDGAVHGCAYGARQAGERLRELQSGNLKAYALWMGGGATVLSLLWLAV